jgi:hypothetical protein
LLPRGQRGEERERSQNLRSHKWQNTFKVFDDDGSSLHPPEGGGREREETIRDRCGRRVTDILNSS